MEGDYTSHTQFGRFSSGNALKGFARADVTALIWRRHDRSTFLHEVGPAFKREGAGVPASLAARLGPVWSRSRMHSQEATKTLPM